MLLLAHICSSLEGLEQRSGQGVLKESGGCVKNPIALRTAKLWLCVSSLRRSAMHVYWAKPWKISLTGLDRTRLRKTDERHDASTVCGHSKALLPAKFRCLSEGGRSVGLDPAIPCRRISQVSRAAKQIDIRDDPSPNVKTGTEGGASDLMIATFPKLHFDGRAGPSAKEPDRSTRNACRRRTLHILYLALVFLMMATMPRRLPPLNALKAFGARPGA